ncbi:MAG TPA: response regulator [Tepidisphaeraceae bacterium]|nr:response regulator [Tepidisphaeraceae bacterium]
MATILVLEDDGDAAEPMVKALQKVGHRAMWVPDGHDALAVLVLGGVDLLLTDLSVPQMDGVTLLEALRAHSRFQSLPVIVFSAYAEGRNAERLRDLGVSDVFVKGTDGPSDVLRAVERHLGVPPRPEAANN